MLAPKFSFIQLHLFNHHFDLRALNFKPAVIPKFNKVKNYSPTLQFYPPNSIKARLLPIRISSQQQLSPRVTNILDWGFFFPQTNPFRSPALVVPKTVTPRPFLEVNTPYKKLNQKVFARNGLSSSLNRSAPYLNDNIWYNLKTDYLPLKLKKRKSRHRKFLPQKWPYNAYTSIHQAPLRYDGLTPENTVQASAFVDRSKDNLLEKFKPITRINITRFRPGLRHLWKELRLEHAALVGLKSNSQNKITKFVMLQKATTGFAFVKTLALSAAFILKQASLFAVPPRLKGFNFSLTQNFQWNLNGAPLTNTLIQVYPGDILVQTTFLSNLSPISSTSVWSQTRLWRRWKLKQAYKHFSCAPSYLEIDELTMSVSLLFNPTKLSQLDPLLWAARPFLTHRLLNWKRVT